MVFGAYVNGHYFNAVAKSADEAQVFIWRQYVISYPTHKIQIGDVLSPFRVT
jgi:hypothetical protein